MMIPGFLQKYDMQKLICYTLYQDINKPNKYQWIIKTALRFFYRILFNGYKIKYQDTNNSILYFDRTMNMRNDIKVMLVNLFKVFDDKSDIVRWEKAKRFSFARFLSTVLFSRQCWAYFNKYPFWTKVHLIQTLIVMNDMAHDLDSVIDWTRYKLCFCFYDAETFQNFLIQHAKQNNCLTATLQHGIMLAKRSEISNNLDFLGIEFEAFVSDYFLVWNEFTKKEAIKSGIPEEKIKVLGVVKCIGKAGLKRESKSKTIGVILDGVLQEENNKYLINISQNFAKSHSFKCLFRYHPDFKGTEYNDIIDASISEVCQKGISLEEFIRCISFCIVANSTVLFELEYYGVPVLRYSSDNMKDKFRDYPSHYFTSEKDISEVYDKLFSSSTDKTMLNADNLYKEFFLQFIN